MGMQATVQASSPRCPTHMPAISFPRKWGVEVTVKPR
jgi:hypothetical protein